MAKFVDNLAGVREEDIDEVKMAPGWYLVTLVQESEDTKDGAFCLRFQVNGPTFRGVPYTHRLPNPALAETEEKGNNQLAWLRKWAKRLGLIRPEDLGKSVEIDFAKALGKQFVLEFVPERYESKKSPGTWIEGVKVPYLGVYGTDHESVPPVERVRMGLALLPGQRLPAVGSPTAPVGKGKAGAAAVPPAGSTTGASAVDLSDI